MTTIHRQTFGQGQPIVLVHGWAMHSGIWRHFAENLAQRYRVICIDLPGHGQSEPMTPFTLERISTVLADAIAEPCCWLGWSLGASIVLDLAGRFPERVDSLILLAGNPSFTRSYYSPIGASPNISDAWPGMETQLLNSFADRFADNAEATLLGFLALQVNGMPDAKTLLKQLKSAVSQCEPPDVETLRQGLKILKEADLRPILSRLKIPSAAILGGRDTLVPVAVGSKMRRLLPQLQLTILDGAGHVPFLTHQAELVAVISRFMEPR